MEDDKLSHDLLALAGHNESDSESNCKANSSYDDFDSNGDDRSPQQSPKADNFKSAKAGKALRKIHEKDREISYWDEDSIASLYSLEGKYKDEADRARLLAMSEIERESILYEREEEIAKMQEKLRLAQRLLKQQEQDQARKVPARDCKTSSDGVRTSQLSELRARREAKLNKRKLVEIKRVEDSDSNYAEDSDNEQHEEVYEEKPAVDEVIDLNDVNSIRLGRKHCARFMFHPMFSTTIIGCFVLIKIGEISQSGQSVYRLCTVKNSVYMSKTYKVEGINTNIGLECLHGTSSKIFEMNVISNEPIDQASFEKWVATVEKENLVIPTKRRARKKLEELVNMTKHVLTGAEIDEMIKLRKSVNSIPTNVALEKTNLKQQINAARLRNDEAAVQELEMQLNKLIELTMDRKQAKHLDALAKVNDRNRKANIHEIRNAEIKFLQEQKRNAAQKAQAADPFSRFKTAPRLFVDDEESLTSLKSCESQNVMEMFSENERFAPAKRTGPDELIANSDINIDIKI